jgi:hypothetical protein
MVDKRRWKVQLTGDELDLEELPVLFASGDPTIIKDGHAYYLVSSAFERLNDADDVRRAATEFIEIINGLSRTIQPEYQPSAVDTVVREGEDGPKQILAFSSAKVTARAKLKFRVTRGNGTQDPDPNEGRLTGQFLVARQYEPIQRALAFVNRKELTWNDLYRAAEVVQEDVGGQMYNMGWISEKVFSRFTGTANSFSVLGRDARHGRDRTQPPPNPMPFEEARALVFRLLAQWIESKSKTGSSTS